jgi:hypothetical protein
VSPAARGAGEGPARGGAELQLGGEARDGGGRGAAHRSKPTERYKADFCLWLLESASFCVCDLLLCARPKPTYGSRSVPSVGDCVLIASSDKIQSHFISVLSKWNYGNRNGFSLVQSIDFLP